MISYANLSNLKELEALYTQYRNDPLSIDPSLRSFFEGMELGLSSTLLSVGEKKEESPDLRIYLLIDAYRQFGHLTASYNPIATQIPPEPIELQLGKIGFQEEEAKLPFPTCGFLKENSASLQEIVEALKKTYSGKIGIEYMGLGSVEIEKWVQQKIEPYFPLHLAKEERIRIMQELNKAELFESFLHTKYVGQKRFSLEGAETLIPMLSAMIEKGAEMGIQEGV
ncbi:MAG: 2-oxoglutarate dehydrogenase subunit E1, partial [Chlamydiales bacterium]|nr:2-oxoglutarate dehydrogenase subunit E1 [Chlamydiales bacterium]